MLLSTLELFATGVALERGACPTGLFPSGLEIIPSIASGAPSSLWKEEAAMVCVCVCVCVCVFVCVCIGGGVLLH